MTVLYETYDFTDDVKNGERTGRITELTGLRQNRFTARDHIRPDKRDYSALFAL